MPQRILRKDGVMHREYKDVGFWPETYGQGTFDFNFEAILNLFMRSPEQTSDVARKAVEAQQDAAWRRSRPNEYAAVCWLLSNPESKVGYYGWSDCRVCGIQNGTHDYHHGRYRYPEGYLHYVVEHDVKPPEDFIAYAVAQYGRRGAEQ